MKKTFILFLAAAVTAFSMIGFGPQVGYSKGKQKQPETPKEQPVYGGVYRKALGHDPASLDPAKMTDIYEGVVTQQIFEGLVQYSDNLMVLPCLAVSWESSRDNKEWVFRLKKGAMFHNGREVTADDFVYTFTRILSPETGSIAASLLSMIEGAKEFREGKTDRVSGLKAQDRYTLQINLAEHYPPFIAVMAMVNFGVVPREEIEKSARQSDRDAAASSPKDGSPQDVSPQDRGEFGTRPVGTGPFRFERWERGKNIVLKANENYHEGRPYLDGVEFMIFPGVSIDQMMVEFEAGRLEDSEFPPAKRDTVITGGQYLVLRRPSLVIRMLVMNNTVPPFDDRRVRQAFNYAIDKKKISEEVGGGRLIPAISLIPEGMAGYQPNSENYPYSPEKAARLLEQAGYPNGKGLPVIQFWSSVKSKGTLQEDSMIKEYLSAVGVKMEPNYQTEWPIFKQMIQEGKAPIFKYSWEADIPDPDNILSSLYQSKSQTNRAFYRNPKVDSLIGRAQSEPDYRKRISLYIDAQDRIMEDAPVIPLSYIAYERVFQSYVRGFEGKAIGDPYFSMKRVWFTRRGG